MEQASEHQTKDEILLDQLHNAQKRQNDAKALCEGRSFTFWVQHMS